MAKSGKTLILWGFLAGLFLLQGAATAEITFEHDTDPAYQQAKGVRVITFPDGQIAILEAGDAVPRIPSGSTIEVFDGHMFVATEEGDEVTLACLGTEAAAGGGSSASLSCGEEKGLLKVRTGFVILKDEQGTKLTLKAPEEFPIALGKFITPAPTADDATPGFAATQDNPADSTSIDASTLGPPGPTTLSS